MRRPDEESVAKEVDPSRRVEEKLTFLEREVDHLREELRELWSRVTALEKRCDNLATRMEGSEEAD